MGINGKIINFILIAHIFMNTAIKVTATPKEGDIRLVNGPNKYSGRLEIYHNNVWGTVCSAHLDDMVAAVACKQLGFYGGKLKKGATYGKGYGNVWLETVFCRWTALSLSECTNTWSAQSCDHSHDAGVECSADQIKEGSVRLADGVDVTAGRVEVFHDGVWGTVCDDMWGSQEAAVVCRQLGYKSGIALLRGHFGEGSGPVWFSGFQCTGSESSLADCLNATAHSCSHKTDAGVACSTDIIAPDSPPRLEEGDLRLVGGVAILEGLVEVYYKNEWGTICDGGWDDVDSVVACRQLGYYNGGKTVSSAGVGRGSGPVLLRDIQCSGFESALSVCPHSPWGNTSCTHERDVTIRCSGALFNARSNGTMKGYPCFIPTHEPLTAENNQKILTHSGTFDKAGYRSCKCWEIRGSIDQNVTVHIEKLDIDSSKDVYGCSLNYLKIYDADNMLLYCPQEGTGVTVSSSGPSVNVCLSYVPLTTSPSVNVLVLTFQVASKIPVWVWITASTGGVVVIGALVLTMFCCCKKRNQVRRIYPKKDSQTGNSHPPEGQQRPPTAFGSDAFTVNHTPLPNGREPPPQTAPKDLNHKPRSANSVFSRRSGILSTGEESGENARGNTNETIIQPVVPMVKDRRPTNTPRHSSELESVESFDTYMYVNDISNSESLRSHLTDDTQSVATKNASQSMAGEMPQKSPDVDRINEKTLTKLLKAKYPSDFRAMFNQPGSADGVSKILDQVSSSASSLSTSFPPEFESLSERELRLLQSSHSHLHNESTKSKPNLNCGSNTSENPLGATIPRPTSRMASYEDPDRYVLSPKPSPVFASHFQSKFELNEEEIDRQLKILQQLHDKNNGSVYERTFRKVYGNPKEKSKLRKGSSRIQYGRGGPDTSTSIDDENALYQIPIEDHYFDPAREYDGSSSMGENDDDSMTCNPDNQSQRSSDIDSVDIGMVANYNTPEYMSTATQQSLSPWKAMKETGMISDSGSREEFDFPLDDSGTNTPQSSSRKNSVSSWRTLDRPKSAASNKSQESRNSSQRRVRFDQKTTAPRPTGKKVALSARPGTPVSALGFNPRPPTSATPKLRRPLPIPRQEHLRNSSASNNPRPSSGVESRLRYSYTPTSTPAPTYNTLFREEDGYKDLSFSRYTRTMQLGLHKATMKPMRPITGSGVRSSLTPPLAKVTAYTKKNRRDSIIVTDLEPT